MRTSVPRRLAAALSCAVACSAATAAPAYTFELLHAFDGNDGNCPIGRMVRGPDAAWYGTTLTGSASGGGTVWRLADGGRLTTLHAFDPAVDGTAPNGLVFATDGNFYGVARGSSFPPVDGIAYKLTPQGEFSVLHTFGLEMPNELMQGQDGALYGTTPGGVVYRLTLDGQFSVLLAIDESAPGAPKALVGALAQGAPGTFYGTSSAGGKADRGTVFEVASSGALTVLHSFFGKNDGQTPLAGPTFAPDGLLAGTTSEGGDRVGMLWAIAPGGAYGGLSPWPDDESNGAFPQAPLTFDRHGTAYGTTQNVAVDGTLSPAGNLYQVRDQVLAVLHTFAPDGSEGMGQDSPLTVAPDGTIYGLSCTVGPRTAGTIYRLEPVSAGR
jgi:uncharacterized repeat protein (TIGR03803 family)